LNTKAIVLGMILSLPIAGHGMSLLEQQVLDSPPGVISPVYKRQFAAQASWMINVKFSDIKAGIKCVELPKIVDWYQMQLRLWDLDNQDTETMSDIEFQYNHNDKSMMWQTIAYCDGEVHG